MEIKKSHLKIGGEVDFGSYGEFGKDQFRLSLRYNSQSQEFELYKHFFPTLTSREEPEEVVMSNADLEAVVREADRRATELSGVEWKDVVVLDMGVCENCGTALSKLTSDMPGYGDYGSYCKVCGSVYDKQGKFAY